MGVANRKIASTLSSDFFPKLLPACALTRRNPVIMMMTVIIIIIIIIIIIMIMIIIVIIIIIIIVMIIQVNLDMTDHYMTDFCI